MVAKRYFHKRDSSTPYTRLACGGICLAAALTWSTACFAQARVEIDAIAGQPFGVGRIAVQGAPGAAQPQFDRDSLALTEVSGRALYPAYEAVPVRQLLRELIAAPPRTAAYFLFVGKEPIDITLHTPDPIRQVITPRADPAGYARLLRAWWREYTSPRRTGRARPYSASVESYLTITLARRLQLPLPAEVAAPSRNQIESALGLLAGSESTRVQVERDILLDRIDRGEAANVSLPENPLLAARPEAALPADEQIEELGPGRLDPEAAKNTLAEPIAMRVPVECFYIRTGSFPNFRWLRHRFDDWGGDLRNLISLRGVDYRLNERMERQLALRESALAGLLGERVIADVAIVGSDTFQREGAAIGILFEARNSGALASDINQQRSAALKNLAGATEEKFTLDDRPVSFIFTPGNELRSFYVIDGDYHFVTTSRALAKRFLETSRGRDALGASDEFQYARRLMPRGRNDAAFIYLSRAFFRNLAGPQYQVEMARRTRALVELELVQMARLAARAERQPSDSIEQLVGTGFLPRTFGDRPDGSRVEFEDSGIRDSLRGARGAFLPVPDVEIEAVTPQEGRQYGLFVESIGSNWGSIDPVLVGVQRQPIQQSGAGEKDFERVVVDILASPIARRHFDQLSRWLGSPTDQRVRSTPGDLVSLQAVMRGGTFFSGGDHQLFGALRDIDNPSSSGGLLSLLIPRELRGYVGAWPQPGLLRLIGGGSDVPPDQAGYSRLRTGIWRRQFDQFTVMSLHPEVLDEVTPQLGFEKAPRPAQAWLHTEDLSQSKLSNPINTFGYRQARRATLSNLAFLNLLADQFHVPADRCLNIAEALLDAKLVCTLGGKYEIRQTRDGLTVWTSTALDEPASNYQLPALKWLRGMDADLRMQQAGAALHLEARMPAPPIPGFQLPDFSGFPFSAKVPAGSAPAQKSKRPAELPAPRDRIPDDGEKPSNSDPDQDSTLPKPGELK